MLEKNQYTQFKCSSCLCNTCAKSCVVCKTYYEFKCSNFGDYDTTDFCTDYTPAIEGGKYQC